MKHRWHLSRLAAVLGVAAACGGASPAPATRTPWDRATALTVEEDNPSGVVVAGNDVFYTTGRTVVGDNAVRVAALNPSSSSPASRVVATNPGGSGPNGPLAVSGDDLYVATGFDIMRVSVKTGAVTPVVTRRPTEVTSVTVDKRFLWWTTSNYKSPQWAEVARMPLGGGPIEILASGADEKGNVFQDDPIRKAVAVRRASFYSVVLDGDGAFVANPSALLRVAAGQAPQVVLDESKLYGGALTQIAGDADHIYGAIAGGHNQLFAVPRTGGRPVELARDVDDVKHIGVAGGEVVFMTPAGSGGKENIDAVPVTGGPVRVVTSGFYADGDLAVTADRIVFSADRQVWSAPLR